MISKTDYFKWLNNSDFVSSFQVQDFRNSKDSLYIKLKIILIDKSELYTKEYISKTKRIYSFHWQSNKGKLLIRWDNAPHFKNLKTYPHHKHIENNEKVCESYEISLSEILELIYN